ncbi:MAG: lysine exporter LysO family protein [bacterium]|jgi:uncharacterized membrane protein YbjE (DUF340 family)
MALILIPLFLGLGAGYVGLIPNVLLAKVDTYITWALLLLLFAVGADMGLKKEALREFIQLGPRVLLVPAGVVMGSLAATAVLAVFLGLKWNEGAAIGAGFGWYSLTGVLLTELHSVRLGTLAFLTNVMRESLTIVILPWVQRYLGPLAAIAPGGATTMDVTLPVVIKVAGEEYGLVAFANGFLLSLSVPFLVQVLL